MREALHDFDHGLRDPSTVHGGTRRRSRALIHRGTRRDAEGRGEGQGRRFAGDEAGCGEGRRESFCPRRGAQFREEEGIAIGGVLGGG